MVPLESSGHLSAMIGQKANKTSNNAVPALWSLPCPHSRAAPPLADTWQLLEIKRRMAWSWASLCRERSEGKQYQQQSCNCSLVSALPPFKGGSPTHASANEDGLRAQYYSSSSSSFL